MLRIAAVSLLILMTVACVRHTAEDKTDDGKRSAEVISQLGLAYLEQGKHEPALNKFKQALEIDPAHAPTHHYLGELYRQLGQLDPADHHFRKALDAMPDDSMLNNNYGVFLCQQNEPRRAIKHFMQAVKQPFYKTPEIAYKNAGLCAMKIPDYQFAEENLRTALATAPTLAPALYGLAEISHIQKKYFQARAFLQRYFAVESPTAQSLWLGIQIERELGDKQAVAEYAMQLRDKFPDAKETAQLVTLEGAE